MEIGIEHRPRAVKVQVPDTQVIDRGEDNKGPDGFGHEAYERGDEVRLVDPGCVRTRSGISAGTAAVADDDINRLKTGGVSKALCNCVRCLKHRTANSPGVAEGFKMWKHAAHAVADMAPGD